MKENGINFIVFAPPWNPTSGGIVALHKLCHEICSLGENGFICSIQKNPNYLGNLLPFNKNEFSFDDENTIVIYPEIIEGNPLDAKNVVRWWLNTPGTNNNIVFTYSANDMIYKYSDAYDWGSAKRENNNTTINGNLIIVNFDLKLFFDRGLKRTGDCFLIRKGKINKQYHSDSAICLDNYYTYGAEADIYLSDIFNSCETFISYDTHTFLNVQAALCGCKSVVIPSDDLPYDKWINTQPYTANIAYGFDDIKRAQHDENKIGLINQLKNKEQESKDTVKNFIKDMYERLNIDV